MDYLFIIKLNDQTTDLEILKQAITKSAELINATEADGNTPTMILPYLKTADDSHGIMGIVTILDDSTSIKQKAFFDSIRGFVAVINKLPVDKIDQQQIQPGNLPQMSPVAPTKKGEQNVSSQPSDPAKWARASMEEILAGFKLSGEPNLNSDVNDYQIVTGLKGGIGGKH